MTPSRVPRGARSTQEQVGVLADERLLTLLRQVFPPIVVAPGVQMDAVQYDAGKQAVIAYLAECLRQAREPS